MDNTVEFIVLDDPVPAWSIVQNVGFHCVFEHLVAQKRISETAELQ